MSERWHVYLAGRQKIAWALDEDLHWVRRSLGDTCRWVSLPRARIVHAAWPAALAVLRPAALHSKTVICQADNPPSFYLGTDGFEELARRVDLWIARSSEAEEQFRLLGLPVRRVPYCIDPVVFRPLPGRAAIRETLGLSGQTFVIGNFHRDSEGRDLTRPKRQKGPDVFLEIARGLHAKIPQTVVLLAGPRRHWLLAALHREGIPVVFAGTEPGTTDDYVRNILPRERLNELYQALDACVISSRWEGGPYSVLEALAAGCPVVSSPVGSARDVLPDECLFHSVERAVELLERAAYSEELKKVCTGAARQAAVTHGPGAVAHALNEVYSGLPRSGPGVFETVASGVNLWSGPLVRHRAKPAPGLPADGEGLVERLEYFDSRNCLSRGSLLELASRIRRVRAA